MLFFLFRFILFIPEGKPRKGESMWDQFVEDWIYGSDESSISADSDN